MVNISEIKNDLRKKINEAQQKANKRRVSLNMTGKTFSELFLLQVKFILAEKGLGKTYNIDKNNKEIINQIYFYLVGSPKFKGNKNKGLFLMGSIGTGKTMIINAIINIIEATTNKRFTSLHAKKIFSFLKENGVERLNKRPLFIDDIGKETLEVNDFGTKINVIPDLFAIRYDNNAWTFVTSNYDTEELTEFYGETIIDRFKELFNVLILKGDSRRN